MKLIPIFGAVAMGLAAGSAMAEGWTVIDLGSMADRAECMAMADATIADYRAQTGADGFTGSSEWTTAGYDLRGPVIDALFICPIEAGLVAPFLIVYNEDDDSAARETVGELLEQTWDRLVAGGPPTPTPAPLPSK